ncbi:MAG: NADP oxidoreductase [Actinobacteria bacterium]|nr:NADP oxidoreductase [Actinomycetota bacterium]
MPDKVKLATVWLDGCSGCHMSFLDLDERLIELGEVADLVYSPLVDHKQFPDMVDVTLIEGGVASADDLAKLRKVRAHSRVIVAFGDCAITANVPGMRNPFGKRAVLERAYLENADENQMLPNEVVPELLDPIRPVQYYVPVDAYLPGCPPSADEIWTCVTELLAGNVADASGTARFGR